MKTKQEIITVLKSLPKPALGGIAFDKGAFHDGIPIMNLRDSCVEMITDVIDISKAKEILEFGTHGGSSACLLLSLSEANLTSIDLCNGTGHVEWEFSYNRDYFVPSTEPGLKEVVRIFSIEFPNRFRFIRGSSYTEETIQKYSDRVYQLCFVDGDHSLEGCRKDCQTAVRLNIPFVLVDDYTTGEEIRKACNIPELELIKIYENIHNFANVGLALFKNKKYIEN